MRVAGDAQTNASRDIDPTTNRLPLVLRIWATWRGALVALVIGLVVQLIDVTVLNIPSLVSLLLMVAVFAIFHWRDLTERRNAQEALKASEERYRDLLRDMSERMRTEQTLRNASLTDPLTGLYNRRGALTLAEQQLKTALRHGRAMMVMYADLNHLKQINDTCGHAAGDEALLETARLLQETFRDSDIIARMGGDEFVILAMESSHNSEATLRGRLAGKLDVHNLGRHCGFPLSISLGVAHFDPAHPCSLEELLTAADQRMYADKRRSATRYARSVMRGA